MKKKILFIFSLISCVLPLFAQTSKKYGDKVYVDLTVHGETVSKWVKCYHVYEYDQNGNITYDDDGNAKRYYYNSHGDIIKEIDVTLGKTTNYSYEYDSKGRKIFRKRSVVTKNYSFDNREYYYYDKKGNLIHEKEEMSAIPGLVEATTHDRYYEYDSNGYCTHFMRVDSDGKVYSEEWYEFDKNGNLIYQKRTDNMPNDPTSTTEKWYEYDNAGNVVYEKSKTTGSSYIYEAWFKYDKYGNIIYEKNSTGNEYSYYHEYDKYGNILYTETKYSDGSIGERYYEYEYYKNGTIKSKVAYTKL